MPRGSAATSRASPRTTVGTVTEIYDYLRLLYARVGRPHCPVCGKPISGQSQESIVDQILQLPDGTRFTVNAPVVRDRKGEYKDVFEELRNEGFTRVKVDGELRLLEEEITLDKKFKHTIEVVVDRLTMKPDLRTRLAQSVETAAQLADGLVAIDVVEGDSMLFSEKFACPDHGVSLPELQPRIFSFNSPHGACPRCTGLGAQQEIDPDLLVPDPSLSIDEGALVPWSVGGSSFYESVIQAIAERYEIALDEPWENLTEEEQDLFLYGTEGERVYISYRNRMGRRRSYMLAFEGIVPSLERRYRETDSSNQRERIEEYMSFRPCPVCGGARLKPEVLAVTVGGKNIHQFTQMSGTRALHFLDELQLSATEHVMRPRIIKEIRERLTFLDNVGVGYLQLDRASATLSGGEAQRSRRDDAQPEGHRRRVPDREVRVSDGRVGDWKVHACERDRLQGTREQAPPDANEARRPRRLRRHRVLRQGDRHRPVADRPDAALEPGDVHEALRPHPRAVLADAGGEGPRLQAGEVLVQRPRRPLRDV